MSFLNGYKTYIVAAFTIGFAVVQMWTGAVTDTAGIGMVLAALGASGLRHGISTSAQ